MSERRRDPESLLRSLKEQTGWSSRGRLKIFFGYAAGVGKTYAMLEAARQVKAQGVLGDVGENDIILLHDASESSVLAAFKIIDELKAQGYTFVTVEEILLE